MEDEDEDEDEDVESVSPTVHGAAAESSLEYGRWLRARLEAERRAPMAEGAVSYLAHLHASPRFAEARSHTRGREGSCI